VNVSDQITLTGIYHYTMHNLIYSAIKTKPSLTDASSALGMEAEINEKEMTSISW